MAWWPSESPSDVRASRWAAWTKLASSAFRTVPDRLVANRSRLWGAASASASASPGVSATVLRRCSMAEARAFASALLESTGPGGPKEPFGTAQRKASPFPSLAICTFCRAAATASAADEGCEPCHSARAEAAAAALAGRGAGDVEASAGRLLLLTGDVGDTLLNLCDRLACKPRESCGGGRCASGKSLVASSRRSRAVAVIASSAIKLGE